jgi:uncharacterized protein (TIGR01777 family)
MWIILLLHKPLNNFKKMQTILITGGTGLVGKALGKLLLQSGYQVIILSRKLPQNIKQKGVEFAQWDVQNKQLDVAALQRADFIIHLAGAGVMDKKWTAIYKKEIVNSRVQSAALIVDSLKKYDNKVKAVISASAIGWYQSTGGIHTEEEPADDSFLGQTCKLWEESIDPAALLGKRLVKLRLGIVLSTAGGALKEFITPQKFGVAAILGNGKQMISWIHIDDLCRLFLFALQNETCKGVYNGVAPNPVNNKTLTLTLAKKRKGLFYIPVHIPGFVLKTVLGERSIEVLRDITASCKKLLAAGFQFQFENIDTALDNLVKK